MCSPKIWQAFQAFLLPEKWSLGGSVTPAAYEHQSRCTAVCGSYTANVVTERSGSDNSCWGGRLSERSVSTFAASRVHRVTSQWRSLCLHIQLLHFLMSQESGICHWAGTDVVNCVITPVMSLTQNPLLMHIMMNVNMWMLKYYTYTQYSAFPCFLSYAI